MNFLPILYSYRSEEQHCRHSKGDGVCTVSLFIWQSCSTTPSLAGVTHPPSLYFSRIAGEKFALKRTQGLMKGAEI